MAKLLDVWGRAEGFALMVGSSTLGVILMAVSKNLATFCAAQVSPQKLMLEPASFWANLARVRSSTPLVSLASYTPLLFLQPMSHRCATEALLSPLHLRHT